MVHAGCWRRNRVTHRIGHWGRRRQRGDRGGERRKDRTRYDNRQYARDTGLASGYNRAVTLMRTSNGRFPLLLGSGRTGAARLRQLGVGSTSLIFSSTPLPVAGGLRFTALSAGVFHTCGRRADGSVFCWGNNSQGQIGNGLPRQFADEFPHSPSRVLGGLAFVEISAGGGHTCGLVSSGAAYCWGSNLVGQLGTPTEICTTFGSIPCSAVPILVSTDLLFSHIVAGGVLTGGSQTCGLTAAGQAYCWGSNEFGELGIGTSLQRTMTPMVVVGGLAFSSISAGAGHTCAVSQEDIPACWGNNAFGQTGDGTSGTNRIRPTIVQEGLEVSSISASTANGHVCTVTKDGAIYCWGMNTIAQLGDGTTTNRSVPVRVRDP